MNILILEDDKTRHGFFRDQFDKPGNYVLIVEEPEPCIDQLEIHDWDAVFLDHDLGGEVYCPSDEKSGFHVAEWLAKPDSKCPPAIYVHSLNTVARKNMLTCLSESRKDFLLVDAPSCWLEEKLNFKVELLLGLNKNK